MAVSFFLCKFAVDNHLANNNYKMYANLLLFGLGLNEIIIIALVVLLLFGGKKIPELMNGLGKGVKSFKEGMNGQEQKEEPEEPIGTDPKA
jgi:sec-independent protein translocase protein TatA